MFSSLLDKFGVMDIIAPLTDVHPLVLAMQQKDFGGCVAAIENGGDLKSLTRTKCGPLHVAVDFNFLEIVEYLINNQIANVGDIDQNGDTPLHYAARKGHLDALTCLVTNGADVLLKNGVGQTAYDVASNLSIRQYLLPLQLKTENDRGLAPILPGVTTAQSLGMGGPVDYGPPPGPMSYTAPPPAPYHPPTPSAPPINMYSPPPYGQGQVQVGQVAQHPPQQPPQQPQVQLHQQPVWQPPHPDGFASGGKSSQPMHQQQTVPYNYASQPPNQYSAFNAGGKGPGSGGNGVAGRYVAYGMQPQQSYVPPPSSYNPPAVNTNSSTGGGYSQISYPTTAQDSPRSPGAGDGGLEEISLSSTSSSVM